MSAALILTLTDDQVETLDLMYANVTRAAEKGRPGVLLAQVGLNNRRELRIGFVPHEAALKISAILTGVANAHRSALTQSGDPNER